MALIDSVHIIYNPNSTGPGKNMAMDLKRKLKTEKPDLEVSLISTKRKGHGEVLAYDIARSVTHPLVISSSGDGGYHDVLNGLLKAQQEGAQPIAGLLPAGNANDHYHNVHTDDIVAKILHNKTEKFDVLELCGTIHGKTYTRYAHSYIGFGITPEIGAELNKTDLNTFREVGIVAKGLLNVKPIKIRRLGREREYSSIVFSNVRKMSKFVKVAKDASMHDGTFKVVTIRNKNTYNFIGKLLKATTLGLKTNKSYTNYVFYTLSPLKVQLDGEVHTLDTDTKVVIRANKEVLQTII